MNSAYSRASYRIDYNKNEKHEGIFLYAAGKTMWQYDIILIG